MNIDSITKIFTIISTGLWTNLQSFFLIALVISLISSVFVEAIKNADEYVFRKVKADNITMWLLNLVLILFLSFSFVIIFDTKKDLLINLLYTTIIWVFSWSISIPIYYLLKFSKHIYIILSYKLKNIIENERLDYLTLSYKIKDVEKKIVLNETIEELSKDE
jgi:hypothetical protein